MLWAKAAQATRKLPRRSIRKALPYQAINGRGRFAPSGRVSITPSTA